MSASGIDLSRVHLIGIGGSGMSGVARILLDRGSVVSGSDAKDSRPVRVLGSMGAHVAVGHQADNLMLSGDLPTVVVTSFAAIPKDNPELVAAAQHNIPVIRRSDLLGELMDGYRQVLLAGTHGKTSTTSMTVAAMQAAGLDPSFAIGGQLNKAGTNAHHGTGDAFVAEADESDASLLRYQPDVAVVTNIEPDHLDYFGTHEAYYQVFDDFAERVTDNGHLVVCVDDENAAALGKRAAGTGLSVLGYGTSAAFAAHPQIPRGIEITDHTPTENGSNVAAVLHVTADGAVRPDRLSGYYSLDIPGEHMVLNSAAAFLAGVLSGGEPERLAQGLSEFTGVRRRFEYKGTIADGHFAGTRVYDDYAHHPTEVDAVLTAARQTVEAEGRGARVVACFQPHLYSRTVEFAKEFARALNLADVAVVLDIFGAREQPIDGVDSRIITSQMDTTTTVVKYEPDFSATPQVIRQLTQPGDLILTMGAGTVTILADEILAVLGKD